MYTDSDRNPANLALGLLLTLPLIILLPLILRPPALPSRDSGVFLYTGWRISEGDLPYRDIWDHKPPVIYYLNTLGLLIGRGSTYGVWVYEVVSLAIAAGLGYIVLSEAFGKLSAFAGSLLWLLTVILVLGGGNFAEEYALPLQFLALLSFIQAEKAGSYTWQGYAIGFSLSLASFLRPNLVAIWVAIIIHIVFRGRRRDWNTMKKAITHIITAFATTTGLMMAPVIIHNQLDSFWEAVITYNVAYSTTDMQNRLQSISTGIEALSRSGLFFLSLLGLLIMLLYLAFNGWSPLKVLMGNCIPDVRARLKPDREIRRPGRDLTIPFEHQHSRGRLPVHGRETKTSLLSVALIAFPIEVIFTTISGRSYLHYYISWLPVSSVFATFTLFVLLRISYRFLQGSSTIVIIGLLLIIVPSAVQPLSLLRQQFRGDVAGSDRKDQALIEYIRTSTSDEDHVLVWGAESGLNFRLRRQSPSRYVYQYPLFAPSPHYEIAAEEFYRDIKAHSPAFIVDTSPSNRRIPPLDGEAGNDTSRMLDLPQLKLFLDYVRDNYVLVGTMGTKEWLVYRYAR